MERAKAQLCTKFEDGSATGFGDIVAGMLNVLGVTCPRPRPLSRTLYTYLVGRTRTKLRTKFEDARPNGFGDIVDGMQNFLGVACPRPCLLSEMLHPILWEAANRSCVHNLNSVALLILEIQ